MANGERLDQEEISALVRAEIDDAIGYDSGAFQAYRRQALEYYRGVMGDVPAREGRSSIVSHDVADTIGWILPSIVRVFMSSDQMVEYLPRKPQDKEAARQATEYVNYLFLERCNGYRVLWNSIHDALLLRNGIIKHWYENDDQIEDFDVSGVPDDVFAAYVQDPNVEVVEHSEEQDLSGMVFHSARLRKRVSSGRLCVEPVPREDFLIDRRASSIEDAMFVAHRDRNKSRSDLIEEGFDPEIVERLPPWHTFDHDQAFTARDEEDWLPFTINSQDRARDLIEVYECYVKIDHDGDGVVTWHKVIFAGNGGDGEVLEVTEWTDELPFTDIPCEPVPHRFEARSIADDTMDVQRFKTVLIRQLLDNLYWTNNPVMVAEGRLDPDTEDALANPNFGETITVPAGTKVMPLPIPFVAQQSFPMLEYADRMIQQRTGVTPQGSALDPDAINNQTATAVQLRQNASYSKIELIARNMAELGFKRLFKCLLKLIVKYQNVPDIVRLRDGFVPMMPCEWSADMDVSINVGLGTGSREKDAMALGMILQHQWNAMTQFGPGNPIVGPSELVNTAQKMIEAYGLKNPQMFFKDVNPQELQQYMQAMSQPKPDPKVQADMMKEQARLQTEMQLKQAEMAMQKELKAAEIQASRDKEASQMQADLETNRAKMQADLVKGDREAQQKAAIELQRIQADMQKHADMMVLEREKMAHAERLKTMELRMREHDAARKADQADRHKMMDAEASNGDAH